MQGIHSMLGGATALLYTEPLMQIPLCWNEIHYMNKKLPQWLAPCHSWLQYEREC